MAQPSPRILPSHGASASVEAHSLARNIFFSLRPEQWTKNLLIFAAPLFGRLLLDGSAVARASGAFAVFCALSGAVYLINDVLDREADQRHPLKALRPIASGALAPATAVGVAVTLALVALLASTRLGAPFALASLSYFALQALYSGPLKQLVILDVLTIAIGFVLRAVAGALAVAVPISHWLLVCTILLALFLALAKRRHELVLLSDTATTHRTILQEYSPYLLDQMIAIVAAATIMGYALYTVSAETIAKFGTDQLLFTLPFPIYGVFRYLYLVHQKQGGGSPSDLLLHDRPLLTCVVLWVAAVLVILYRPFALPAQ